MNLAVVTGAPIRLNAELFSMATADDDSEEPTSFPSAARHPLVSKRVS